MQRQSLGIAVIGAQFQLAHPRFIQPAMRLLLALFALLAIAAPGHAQNAYNLFVVGSGTTSYATLQDAIYAANGASSQATLSIDYNLTGGTVSLSSQLVIGLNKLNSGGLLIEGNNVTLDMNGQDRAFFIASGNVSLQNMTIANGLAKGGSGGNGGGGGAGFGGAIFIANPTFITTGGDGTFSNDNLVLPTAVTLSGVSFSNNTATGGRPGNLNGSGPYNSGGGGGMGGDGGSGIANDISIIGGGGGGFGNGADGGTHSGGSSQGGSGAMVFTLSPLSAAPGGGAGGDESNGGLYAGGGGMGENDDVDDQSGGGGGANAESGHSSEGGNGGFGGGGGGATSNSGSGGNGGFGGGGGANVEMDSFGTVTPGNGGFGGGGGVGAGGNSDIVLGQGGFAAGDATDPFLSGNASGGAGASLGGAVFVMSGASLTITRAGFSSNQAQVPVGADLTGYGDDIFLGGDVTFSVAANETVSLTNLGGAGNLSDPTVSAHQDDLNAQGGIIAQGPGTVQLKGSANFYSGSTVVNQGTLALAAGAVEVGTASVTVGQIDGLQATLSLGSNSGLFLKGFDTSDVQSSTDLPVLIAQGVGSRGKIIIGAGAGSSGADLGARVFNGAGGTATVEFQQQYAFNSNSDTVYHFYTTLTGALDIEQTGPGTTLLNPIYGANSFTGEVRITGGILGTAGATAALAGATSITLDGGDFEIGQSNGINDSATLNQGDGTVRVTANFIEQTFGAWNITASTVLDFNEFAADLTFASLTISGPLAIYNYDAEDNFITILSGTATGSLSQIAFYSDEGDTFIGTGTINGTSLDVVPEPSTWALLGLGVLILGLAARRRAAAR